jgi:hypothetical protein
VAVNSFPIFDEDDYIGSIGILVPLENPSIHDYSPDDEVSIV